jgi:hypothetical protein
MTRRSQFTCFAVMTMVDQARQVLQSSDTASSTYPQPLTGDFGRLRTLLANSVAGLRTQHFSMPSGDQWPWKTAGIEFANKVD